MSLVVVPSLFAFSSLVDGWLEGLPPLLAVFWWSFISAPQHRRAHAARTSKPSLITGRSLATAPMDDGQLDAAGHEVMRAGSADCLMVPPSLNDYDNNTFIAPGEPPDDQPSLFSMMQDEPEFTEDSLSSAGLSPDDWFCHNMDCRNSDGRPVSILLFACRACQCETQLYCSLRCFVSCRLIAFCCW